MELFDYINRGGILVYILVGLNIIGFSLIFLKLYILRVKKQDIDNIAQTIYTKYTNKDLIINAINSEIKQMEFGLNTIKIIATISPLIGLLGTVIGVLDAFDSISSSGLGDPTVFSYGISVALITTVAGMIVAIPHYIAYNYFIGVLDNIELKLTGKVLEKI
jgi:biopolymer transport protein ExbB